MSYGIPPLEPLAPIVDQMRQIARDELPTSRTCKVRLWDDGTFDAKIYHSGPSDEWEAIRYERTTGEILYVHILDANQKEIPLSGGETIIEPADVECETRVITTVEPPYR